jgi:rod shape determining protein RodA
MAWAHSNRGQNPLVALLTGAGSLLLRGGPAWIVVLASLLLAWIGLRGIDVAESPRSVTTNPLSLGPVAIKQLAFLGVGMLAAIAAALPHYKRFGPWIWSMYVACLFLLIFLIIPGVPASIVRARGGARAWIDLGPIDLQPSELVKIACVLAVAWYLRYRKTHRELTGLWPPAFLVGLPIMLIMLQPDMGTCLLFIPMLFFMLVAAGARLRHLSLVIAVACLAAPAAYPLLKPHQKQRIVGLVLQLRGDTSEDLDVNMQSVTAQRMIGAGQTTGTGDTHARALLRFNALPERHNDMVFASIVARYGLLGGVVLLLLFAAWVVGAFWTAGSCDEPFGRLICVGCAGFVVAQVLVNIGMNLGIVPIIGVTLPFVSYGGSSMVAQWLMVGLVLNVGLRRRGSYELSRSFEWDRDE